MQEDQLNDYREARKLEEMLNNYTYNTPQCCIDRCKRKIQRIYKKHGLVEYPRSVFQVGASLGLDKIVHHEGCQNVQNGLARTYQWSRVALTFMSDERRAKINWCEHCNPKCLACKNEQNELDYLRQLRERWTNN